MKLAPEPNQMKMHSIHDGNISQKDKNKYESFGLFHLENINSRDGDYVILKIQ